jgi:hypothetical protein
MGCPLAIPLGISIRGAQLHNVYFHAQALLEKSNRLTFEQTFTKSQLPSVTPVKKIVIDDVQALLDRVEKQLGGIKRVLVVSEAPLSTGAGSKVDASELLLTILGINKQINLLLERRYAPRGQTGKMVSDMIPHLAELTDDIAFIHSLTSKSNTHGPAENFLSTGFVQDGFPSLGGWASYALGSEDQDLPAFVSIPDPRGVPQASVNNWGPGFLPAEFQGTTFSASKPLGNLAIPKGIDAGRDRAARALLQRMNARHLEQHPGDGKLAARIASYELAARMQLSVPAISDLSTEPAHVLKSYGADDTANPTKAGFAKNCILARRLLERGVRFVQLFNGAYASGGKLNWDGRSKLKEQYDVHAEILDQPAAALIRDLKQRGLLEETLVVWCTEFGRMPMFQKGAQGRDHNPDGFTCWMTGAGIKPGASHGVTDELGRKAISDVHPLYDFNATILHLLGLDHEQLTFFHNGIERRLTNVEGHVIQEILS